MGICYSYQEQSKDDQQNFRKRRKNKKKKNSNSIIYQQKSFHQSFASKVEDSFRQDLHNTLNNIASDFGSIAFGSVAEMSQTQLQVLQKSLKQINIDGEKFDANQVVTFCNLKTKNYLHTHKIKHPCFRKFNQASACPYNSNHIVQYDLWKIIPIENDKNYIYHPLTQTFLGVSNGKVVCGEIKYSWKIQDYGPRRNGGFLKLIAQCQNGQMQLCMTDHAGILSNHRSLELCVGKHIGHLWELNFGECIVQ